MKYDYVIEVLEDKLWHRKQESKEWQKNNNKQQAIIHKNLAKELELAIKLLKEQSNG